MKHFKRKIWLCSRISTKLFDDLFNVLMKHANEYLKWKIKTHTQKSTKKNWYETNENIIPNNSNLE